MQKVSPTPPKKSGETRRITPTPPKKPWWKNIGVEPVMFLYMMAFMLTSVVEEAFFVYKACHVNLGLSDKICNNLTDPENHELQKQVQLKVSTFHQYENIASHLVPVILAFFLGPWSDKVGRKLPLLLGLFGNFVYSLMIAVNASFPWPLEMVLLTACLPCALTGGNLTVFMACFAYLADTTSQKMRTLRCTLLEVAYLIPMPVGVALGSYLFTSVFNQSYAKMFVINAILLFLAFVYTMAFIEWNTSRIPVLQENQRPREIKENLITKEALLIITHVIVKIVIMNLWDFNTDRFVEIGCFHDCYTLPMIRNFRMCSWIFDLIDLRHVVKSIRALVKKRKENRRCFLILTLIAMAFYTFQRDEKHFVYLYTSMTFKWDVPTFSQFRTFQSSFFVGGLLIGVPILERCFGLRDNVMVMIGAMAHLITRIIYSSAEESFLFYIGAVIASLGPIVAPILRSLASKLVPASDRGKIFSLLSVADSTVPLISGVIYTQIYNHTINTFPQSIFLVTAVSQMIVFFISLAMDIVSKRTNISQAPEEGRW